MGTQEISFLVKDNDKLLIDKAYMEDTLKEANRKMKINEEMLIRLEGEARKKAEIMLLIKTGLI